MGCSFSAGFEGAPTKASTNAERPSSQDTELVTRVVLKLFGVPLVALIVTVLSLPDSMVITWQAAVVFLVTGLTLMWMAWPYKDWK